MATEKMTLEAAKQIIIKHLPDDFLKDDKNREALSLMGTAFEQFKVLTDENLRLIQESEKQQAEINELKHEREVLLEDIHHSADQINEQIEEIEEARIGVKSYKGKYESASKTAKELQTVIAEKEAEIERLLQKLQQPQAEAIKEFAERLKNRLKGNGGLLCVTTMNIQIDNLVKEMVGDDK